MGPFGTKDTVPNSGVPWGNTFWRVVEHPVVLYFALLYFAHISALAHCIPSGL